MELLQLLAQLNTNKSSTGTISNHVFMTIVEKLNNKIYTKWEKLMYLAISWHDCLNHIIEDLPPSDDGLEGI